MSAPDFGNYETERVLGAGSFATVWLANDPLLDNRVAIKVLADNWSRNQEVRDRFLAEARILRQISHDAVVRIHLIDELASGQPFFVMEWADRGTLADRMEDHAGKTSPADAVATAVEMLRCLTVVHDFGIVHRDMKPSNVLFRSERAHERAAAARNRDGVESTGERVVLGDFGLAKNVLSASGFTKAAGTPTYMAPEQTQSSASIDARADLYAVGGIVFELLTGRPPVDVNGPDDVRRARQRGGTIAERLREHREDVDPQLAGAIEALLQVAPADRPSSADAAIGLLTAAQPVIGEAPTTDADAELRQALADGAHPLSDRHRAEAIRILTRRDPWQQLAPDVAPGDRTTAVLAIELSAAIDRWRGLQSRLPFTARPVAERIVELLEQLWERHQL